MEQAIFAAGCFWGIEEYFLNRAGVTDTKVGYIGGNVENPTYKQVCGGDTEHAEAVLIMFDPQRISYAELLQAFWQCHDPTQRDRQGLDVGRQYRSAIFYADEQQKTWAEQSKQEALVQFSRPIVTEIIQAPHFYPAEDYHQKYIRKQRGLI